VDTVVHYLARDKLYETEKPYNVEFEPEQGDAVRRSNVIVHKEPMTVHAIQASDEFDIDTNGFCVIDKEIPLDANIALTDPDSVEADYLRELEAILSFRFPEYKRIEPLEFLASS
jgi:hypothetical protein